MEPTSQALEDHPHSGHMTEIDPGRSGASCSHMHRLGLAATVSEERGQIDEVWRCRDQAGEGNDWRLSGGREEREPCRCTARRLGLTLAPSLPLSLSRLDSTVSTV